MPNKLTGVRVGEVSFCRKGMNQHARVALFKSADTPTTPKEIAKATFADALEGNMIAGAVNDAFYQSFDGLWERNDAFKVALTDELAAGGDGTTASADYVASVKALVDEAVAEARKAGATAADTTSVEKALTAAADRWLDSKRKDDPMLKITNKAELTDAIAKFDPAKSPAADVLTIHKAATDLDAEDQLPAEGALAKAKTDPAVATMQRELAVLKLSPTSKSHFDGLDAAGQTAFLAKSEADQATEIAKANEADPIIYTTTKGREIRKSYGQLAADLARDNDELRGDLTKVRGDVTSTTIKKRAAEEFPHVAKNVAVDMLKSVQTLGETTDGGKAMLASLTNMEKQNKGGFRQFGSTVEDTSIAGGDMAKARTTFDGEVAQIAARDHCDRATAMSKARGEHPDLFAEAYPATVEAAESSAEIARSHSN